MSSTCLSNLFTWESIYCLFPVCTALNRHVLFSNSMVVESSPYDMYGRFFVDFDTAHILPEFHIDRSFEDECTTRIGFAGCPAESLLRMKFNVTKDGIRVFDFDSQNAS